MPPLTLRLPPPPSTMAVDLIFGSRTNSPFASSLDEITVKEAASGLENVEKFISLLSLPHPQPSYSAPLTTDVDMARMAVVDAAVAKFKRVISLLGRERTGHARFRRGAIANPAALTTVHAPVQIQEHTSKVYDATPIQQIPPPMQQLPPTMMTPLQLQIPLGVHRADEPSPDTMISFSYTSRSSNSCGNNIINNNATSFVSTLTGENKESLKQMMLMSSGSGFQITRNMLVSEGKPPLLSSSSFKRKCSSDTLGSVWKCGSGSSSRNRHCTKKRKMWSKRVVRVLAISLKMADVPSDEFSWRKYGQKPIKGSPHPRGYYKCSSIRGCPAKKHVERALDDPSMLVVTYDGEHNHSLSVTMADHSTGLILESSR